MFFKNEVCLYEIDLADDLSNPIVAATDLRPMDRGGATDVSIVEYH